MERDHLERSGNRHVDAGRSCVTAQELGACCRWKRAAVTGPLRDLAQAGAVGGPVEAGDPVSHQYL
jgi:hypothetical protein